MEPLPTSEAGGISWTYNLFFLSNVLHVPTVISANCNKNQMLTIVIVGLVLFDLVVETYEHYLHHHKGRFHQNLFKKVCQAVLGTG